MHPKPCRITLSSSRQGAEPLSPRPPDPPTPRSDDNPLRRVTLPEQRMPPMRSPGPSPGLSPSPMTTPALDFGPAEVPQGLPGLVSDLSLPWPERFPDLPSLPVSPRDPGPANPPSSRQSRLLRAHHRQTLNLGPLTSDRLANPSPARWDFPGSPSPVVSPRSPRMRSGDGTFAPLARSRGLADHRPAEPARVCGEILVEFLAFETYDLIELAPGQPGRGSTPASPRPGGPADPPTDPPAQ